MRQRISGVIFNRAANSFIRAAGTQTRPGSSIVHKMVGTAPSTVCSSNASGSRTGNAMLDRAGGCIGVGPARGGAGLVTVSATLISIIQNNTATSTAANPRPATSHKA